MKGTRRERIRELMEAGPLTIRELASILDLSFKEIEEDLEHVRKTVGTRAFRMEPPECLSCGFVFEKRTRLNTPSRCPRCKSEKTSEPVFWIESIGDKKKNG